MFGKKGALGIQALGTAAMTIIFIGVLISVGLMVMDKVQTNVGDESGTDSAAYNATTKTIDAVADLPGWLGIIVIVLAGSVVICSLMAYFVLRR